MPDLFRWREGVVDEWMTATNKDSFDAARQLVEKKGMLVGPSSGSVMTSMMEAAESLEQGDDCRHFGRRR
jgi:S-sulfo-L-cysteine synthase (O-acetyl-L-serine-dependent)